DGIRDRNVTGVQTCALPILIQTSLSWLFSIISFLSSGVPTIIATSKLGANFAHSLRQLYTTEEGTMTKCGLSEGSDNKYAIVCKVLPSPMSSANIPPK